MYRRVKFGEWSWRPYGFPTQLPSLLRAVNKWNTSTQCVDWPLAQRLKGTYFETTRGSPAPSCHSTHKGLLLSATRTAPSRHENYQPCSSVPLSSPSPSTFSGPLLPRCKEEHLYQCVNATVWICVGLCHQGCCVMARGYLICKAGGLLLLYTCGGEVTGSSDPHASMKQRPKFWLAVMRIAF